MGNGVFAVIGRTGLKHRYWRIFSDSEDLPSDSEDSDSEGLPTGR